MTTAWLQLLIAGLLEVGWAIGLKYSDGFNFRARPAASLATLAGMILSMYLLSVAARTLPIGTAYAVWTGIGALGAATLGMVFFREPATAVRIVCLVMLVAGIVGLKLTAPASAQTPTSQPGTAMNLYLGTYTRGTSEGIYRLTFDEGRLGQPTLAAKIKNASFLAIHPTQPRVYAISEVGEFNGVKTGAVTAFAIEADGSLRQLNQQSTGGPGPAFVGVSPDGKAVFVANYSGGSVAMLPLDADGSLQPASVVEQHAGSSVNPKRQDKPYAHSIFVDPTSKYALACDLGTDEVLIYAIDTAAGTMRRAGVAKVEPGSGPRHLAFAPDGKSVYVVNEMGNTVMRYEWANGTLTHRQTVETLPAGFKGENTTAEIMVRPDGRFVYASNRGDDSIAIFAVDPATGALSVPSWAKSGGQKPRNFVIDPAGRYLLTSNEKGNNVVAFAIDASTGALTPTGSEAKVDGPVCLRFTK